MSDTYKYSETTSLIIQAFYKVYNTLKFGFLEKVYENSLLIELRKFGLNCRQQLQIDVFYLDDCVGYYQADIIVNESIIIEIKSAESLCEAHEAQLTNYLRATNIEVGMLLNFGKKPEFKRKVVTAEYKTHLK